MSCETLERLVQRFGVNVTKGYFATNRKAQVNGVGFERQVRPRARMKGVDHLRVRGRTKGANDTALDFINTKTGNHGKGVNKTKSREKGLNGLGGESQMSVNA